MRIFQKLFWIFVFLTAMLAVPIVWKLFLKIADLMYMWVGIIAFVLTYFFWLKTRLRFLQSLDHELAHAITSLMFGNKLIELYVHDRMGGHVQYYSRGRGQILISLVPYVVRLPILFVLLLSALVQERTGVKLVHCLFGVTLAYSYISILEEAKPYQTDLTKHGLLFSYCAVVALNIIWFGIVASIILPKITLWHFIQAIYHL